MAQRHGGVTLHPLSDDCRPALLPFHAQGFDQTPYHSPVLLQAIPGGRHTFFSRNGGNDFRSPSRQVLYPYGSGRAASSMLPVVTPPRSAHNMASHMPGNNWHAFSRPALRNPGSPTRLPPTVNTHHLLAMTEGLSHDIKGQEAVRRVRGDMMDQCRIQIAQLEQEKNALKDRAGQLEATLVSQTQEHDRAMEKVAQEHMALRKEMMEMIQKIKSEGHAALAEQRAKREAAEQEVANCTTMMVEKIKTGIEHMP